MLNEPPQKNPVTPHDECMDTLIRIFNKAAIIEREPADIGDGVLIYTSEVHLIDTVARFPKESISSIALRLGITKGAVSQTVKKLEEKGFLFRANEEGDRKTVMLSLTDSGRRAFDWHRAYHAEVNRQVGDIFSKFSPAEQENVREFLASIERVFDSCPSIRAEVTMRQNALK